MMKKPMSFTLKILIAVMVIIVVLALASYLFLKLNPEFGQNPDSATSLSFNQSVNYKDGEFINQVATPMITSDDSQISLLLNNIFGAKKANLKPQAELPTNKPNFKQLNINDDLFVWLGHSSYYIQLGGMRILIDPIFSKNAAPVSFAVAAFKGTNIFNADDFPDIDLLLITHDHYDHLDYPTIKALEFKTKQVIAGLGMRSHFARWWHEQNLQLKQNTKQNDDAQNLANIEHQTNKSPITEHISLKNFTSKVQEADWYDSFIMQNLQIIALPARHFSGRTLVKNPTLWLGFALITPNKRLFFSGDSGYGPHFADIGSKFGAFDWVTLDSGQYDPRWQFVHMNPEQSAAAAFDLQAKAFTPAHVGRFSLANHDWDEPFKRASIAINNYGYELWTPKIGQVVYLDNPPPFETWWHKAQ